VEKRTQVGMEQVDVLEVALTETKKQSRRVKIVNKGRIRKERGPTTANTNSEPPYPREAKDSEKGKFAVPTH